jgi:16S rRNA processing protein RimM
LPEPRADEVYWTDLIGLAVVNVHGEALGTVDRLLETGANDVLVLRGDRERLVPFVRGAVVKDIDQEAGRITVDWDRDY